MSGRKLCHISYYVYRRYAVCLLCYQNLVMKILTIRISKEWLCIYFLFCFTNRITKLTRLYLFIFFLAVLGLRFCARAFSSCGRRGPLFIAVCGPLTIVASLVAEHRLQSRRLSSCGSRAQLLRGMWDPPRPGLEPVSPALAGRFSTTAPPGKPFTRLQKNIFVVFHHTSEYK